MISKLITAQASNLADELNSSCPKRSYAEKAKTQKSENEILIELNNLGLIGRSKAYKASVKSINKFCYSKAPILLDGKTGSGKELAARALHYLGPRDNQPFISVNCGALPEGMFENELFGHQKGAYTQASSRCRFELLKIVISSTAK
jgi:transcriptional regulator with GAF, ATPase, and Fis domain